MSFQIFFQLSFVLYLISLYNYFQLSKNNAIFFLSFIPMTSSKNEMPS